jgi:hypothetical protein
VGIFALQGGENVKELTNGLPFVGSQFRCGRGTVIVAVTHRDE